MLISAQADFVSRANKETKRANKKGHKKQLYKFCIDKAINIVF